MMNSDTIWMISGLFFGVFLVKIANRVLK